MQAVHLREEVQSLQEQLEQVRCVWQAGRPHQALQSSIHHHRMPYEPRHDSAVLVQHLWRTRVASCILERGQRMLLTLLPQERGAHAEERRAHGAAQAALQAALQAAEAQAAAHAARISDMQREAEGSRRGANACLAARALAHASPHPPHSLSILCNVLHGFIIHCGRYSD